ncbi:MAG: cysteine desulfurase [Armatimonadetes bacterium]|nr:cysteine desulfurase [Armatimonadota bacterium]
MNPIINLDHHATTPTDARVVAEMAPFWELGGNASSPHALGRRAADAIETAREGVAALLGARAGEIVWTSGATEANNLAILGLARAWKGKTARRKIVTSAIEHPAVLAPCRALEREGFSLAILPVDSMGRVGIEAARREIDETTLLVSVQAANSEVGTLQEVRSLAELAHERGAFFHCDAAQAVGKIPVSVAEWDVDLLSLSAHKFGGPMGVGALLRRGGKALVLAPQSFGGGQEGGLRPGTLAVPLIVGLGTAARLAQQEMVADAKQRAILRDAFEKQLQAAIPRLQINGDTAHRLPGASSLTFSDIEAEALLAHLPELMLSTGSACSSGALEPSPVLTALGLNRDAAFSTLRIGLGKGICREEIEVAASQITAAYQRLLSLDC